MTKKEEEVLKEIEENWNGEITYQKATGILNAFRKLRTESDKYTQESIKRVVHALNLQSRQ